MTKCIVTEHQWKDLEGWKDYGISLSTSSNEAAKMLDALMIQLYRWYDDESLGGITGTMKHIREADPDYVLGPLLETRFRMSGHRLEVSGELQESLKEMEQLAKTQHCNEWEIKLVGVITDFTNGYRKKALRCLEQMLVDNPLDVVSLRLAFMFALNQGDWSGLKSIMPKVIATCTPDMAYYGYIQGMFGFILNECQEPKKAEKYTKNALNINPRDCWATHATSHILLETDRAEEGATFLEKNEPHWTDFVNDKNLDTRCGRIKTIFYRKKALRCLEQMLVDNPLDVVSLRLAFMFALNQGDWSGLKSIMPKVIATCTPDMAYYGYIQGMFGFILNECQEPKKAEKYTKNALNINPRDCWATHATSHILLETDRAEEGATFLEKNEPHWTTGTMLLEHNYWHWALFHLDKGDYESVLSILDDHIIARCSPGTNFPLSDASSLLYRLEMEGVPIGKRWQTINSLWSPSEHTALFYDVHMMMNHVGAKDYESADSLLESCEKFVREGKGTNWEITKEVGVSLCEAMMAFDKAKYDDVVELMLPVRDDVIKMGGSNAQRDVFSLLLTNAAFQCSSNKYRNLGRNVSHFLLSKLIKERKQLYGENGVIERLEERFSKQLGTGPK